MRLKRISDFIKELPALRAGRVRDHRDAIEQLASVQHRRPVVINWAQPKGDPVPAVVNHGRWIVRCPYCPGASVAEEGEVFFCPDCLMLENGGYPRPVAFPPEAEAIERLLLERPDETKRNWEVYETVGALQAENKHFLKKDEDAP